MNALTRAAIAGLWLGTLPAADAHAVKPNLTELTQKVGAVKAFKGCGIIPGAAKVEIAKSWGYDFPTAKVIDELGKHTDQMGLESEIYPTIKVVLAPKHGNLTSSGGYAAESGYEGRDYAVWSFEVLGKKYLFEQEFIVSIPRSVKPLPYDCREAWKLPKTMIKSGQLELSPIEGAAGIQAANFSANLSALIANAQQTLTGFTDLPATALGQTVGEGASAAITLDTNAAGHGWYVDPTPLDNADDYLPTSQAGVWQAKAGSAAAHRMDMLSVLLHEYGHALGLEHSAEAGDFMNASLQPGMRKMPTAEQLALMSQIVAHRRGDALTFGTSHPAPQAASATVGAPAARVRSVLKTL